MKENSFLLDTHIFIWAMEENKMLPAAIKNTIIDPQNKIFISAVTLWEVIIKTTTKQIKFKFDLEESIKKAGFEFIPVQIPHILHLATLPLFHKDPFDRMLIAQAKTEKLTLITSDEKIWKYDLPLLKA